MRLSIDVTLDYNIDDSAEILLQVEAAAMTDQHLEHQDMRVFSADPIRAVPGESAIGQRTWARGTGHFRVEYKAIVAIDRASVDFADLPATPMWQVPGDAVQYLMPSRYCESDRFEGFVHAQFGALTGGALAAAIGIWVQANLTYKSGSSAGETTALRTFADRRGVCRITRISSSHWRGQAAFRPAASPPTRPESRRPISTPSPKSGSTVAGT